MFEHDLQSDAKMNEVYTEIPDSELSKREKAIIKTKKIAYITISVIGFALIVVGIIAFVVNLINSMTNEVSDTTKNFFNAMAMFIFGGIISASAISLLFKLGKKKIRVICPKNTTESTNAVEQKYNLQNGNELQKIKCENCGCENEQSDKFCRACGTLIKGEKKK